MKLNAINTLSNTNADSCSVETRTSRNRALEPYGLNALEDDAELAAIVKFVAQLCDVPVSTISIVEAERQLFLAREGIEDRETPVSTSFCAHAMLGNAPLVVPDATSDPRFADFAAVTGPLHVRFYAGAPLVGEDGTPIGALCAIDTVPRPDGLNDMQLQGLQVMAQSVMRRLRDRQLHLLSQSELLETSARLQVLADGIPDIVWSADTSGRIDYCNRRWFEFSGQPAGPIPDSAAEHVHPDEIKMFHAKWANALVAGEPFEMEYRLKHADGDFRWVLARAMPVQGPHGAVIRWIGTVTDIDDKYRESESRELLASELSHRIKNIFAVISGLVALTSRNKPEVKDFAEELTGKIRALGRAHDFVRPIDSAKGDSLHGLLEVLMEPYVDEQESRLTIVGEEVHISVRSATPLALVFHEFATNAAKYGALSVRGGKVAVTITKNGDDAVIEWRETHGPAPVDTDRVGFGSRLVEMTVTSQLRGKLLREMQPEGFLARLTLPLSSL